MKPTVYIETTILGYLSGLPSRDIIVAAHQEITRHWWSTRDNFDCCLSALVLAEAGSGDPRAAARRLSAASGLRVLDYNPLVLQLAQNIIECGAIPQKATADAFHVAHAAAHGVEFLLTWNCTHIANAVMRPRISAACESNGCRAPIICTPEELLLTAADEENPQ